MQEVLRFLRWGCWQAHATTKSSLTGRIEVLMYSRTEGQEASCTFKESNRSEKILGVFAFVTCPQDDMNSIQGSGIFFLEEAVFWVNVVKNFLQFVVMFLFRCQVQRLACKLGKTSAKAPRNALSLSVMKTFGICWGRQTCFFRLLTAQR
jgi:hypothetical protein